jgi:hypothetical protein
MQNSFRQFQNCEKSVCGIESSTEAIKGFQIISQFSLFSTSKLSRISKSSAENDCWYRSQNSEFEKQFSNSKNEFFIRKKIVRVSPPIVLPSNRAKTTVRERI